MPWKQARDDFVPKSGCVLCIHSAYLFVTHCELFKILLACLFVGYLEHKSLGSSKGLKVHVFFKLNGVFGFFTFIV